MRRGLGRHRPAASAGAGLRVAGPAAPRPAAPRRLGGRRLGGRRVVAGGTAALVVIPVALALAGARGLPRERVELSGGSAWLASSTQGLLTLIDGASEQTVGSVRVSGARPGDELSVVQQGSSAYVVNPVRGTVSRVDGGTYEVSAPVRFADGGAGALLQVYPGTTSSYVVDGRRQVASVVDPATLRVRDRLAFAAQPGPGQSVVDGSDRLWVVGRGGLTWFDRAGQHVRPELGDAGSRLVLVDGQPVLVDLGRSRVGPLTGAGTVRTWSCLQLPAGESASLLGSASLGRVLAAVPSTGTLVQSGSGNDSCGRTVDIGRPGDSFGPLVESGGFLFVPNRTLGRTTIVDLAARRVVADLDLVKPGSHLELLAKDGVVFYNDLDSDRAGVIRLDGGRWRAGKALRKYDPANSGDGILVPGGRKAPSTPPDQAGDPRRPGPNQPDQPDQRQPGPDQPNQHQPNPGSTDPNPGSTDPNQPDAGQQPSPSPGAGGPTPTPTPTPTDPGGGPPPPPLKPVIRNLDWTPDPVARGREATFRAFVDNAAGATWAWAVVDPAGVAPRQEQATPGHATFTLPAGSPADMQIQLHVSTAAGHADIVKAFTTTAGVVPQITDLTANPANPGVGQQVTLHGVESQVGDRADRWVWTVTGPAGFDISPQVQPGVDLHYKFSAAGTYTVQLSVEFDGAVDRRSITVTVTDRASLTAVSGSPVDLRSGAQTVTVRLDNSFVAQTVHVTKASWLSVSDTSVLVQPGGTASVTVSVTGTPPGDGVQPAALTFALDNGSGVTYDVQVNVPPVVVDINCISTQNSNIRVTVYNATVSDSEPTTLTVVAHVGAMNLTLHRNTSGNPAFFSVDGPAAIPVVDTWTVEATDSRGLTGTRVEPLRCS